MTSVTGYTEMEVRRLLSKLVATDKPKFYT
jgi:hypothetical protein